MSWFDVIQDINEKEKKLTGKGLYRNVSKVPELTPEELSPKQFLNNHLKASIPVLIKGLAKQWPAYEKW